HCVGIAPGFRKYASQSGCGTDAPVQTSWVSAFDKPVAAAAAEKRFELTVPRNSPTPPRIMSGFTFPGPRPPRSNPGAPPRPPKPPPKPPPRPPPPPPPPPLPPPPPPPPSPPPAPPPRAPG